MQVYLGERRRGGRERERKRDFELNDYTHNRYFEVFRSG
jgi:hypothetical protein